MPASGETFVTGQTGCQCCVTTPCAVRYCWRLEPRAGDWDDLFGPSGTALTGPMQIAYPGHPSFSNTLAPPSFFSYVVIVFGGVHYFPLGVYDDPETPPGSHDYSICVDYAIGVTTHCEGGKLVVRVNRGAYQLFCAVDVFGKPCLNFASWYQPWEDDQWTTTTIPTPTGEEVIEIDLSVTLNHPDAGDFTVTLVYDLHLFSAGGSCAETGDVLTVTRPYPIAPSFGTIASEYSPFSPEPDHYFAFLGSCTNFSCNFMSSCDCEVPGCWTVPPTDPGLGCCSYLIVTECCSTGTCDVITATVVTADASCQELEGTLRAGFNPTIGGYWVSPHPSLEAQLKCVDGVWELQARCGGDWVAGVLGGGPLESPCDPLTLEFTVIFNTTNGDCCDGTLTFLIDDSCPSDVDCEEAVCFWTAFPGMPWILSSDECPADCGCVEPSEPCAGADPCAAITFCVPD